LGIVTDQGLQNPANERKKANAGDAEYDKMSNADLE